MGFRLEGNQPCAPDFEDSVFMISVTIYNEIIKKQSELTIGVRFALR